MWARLIMITIITLITKICIAKWNASWMIIPQAIGILLVVYTYRGEE